MVGFRVEPGELTDGAARLQSAADTLRTVATGGLDGGTGLQGGLDHALARFAERWRDGHGRLAERADDAAARLVRAAEAYVDVDRAVARGAAT